MCRTSEEPRQEDSARGGEGREEKRPSPCNVLLFLLVLLLDAVATVLLTLPVFWWTKHRSGTLMKLFISEQKRLGSEVVSLNSFQTCRRWMTAGCIVHNTYLIYLVCLSLNTLLLKQKLVDLGYQLL